MISGVVQRHAFHLHQVECSPVEVLSLLPDRHFLRVKLEQHVARHQGHLAQVCYVPSANQNSSAIRVVSEHGYYFVNLIVHFVLHISDHFYLVTINTNRSSGHADGVTLPVNPLLTIHGAKVTVFFCPFIPNGAASLFEPVVVGFTSEKPQKLSNDAFEVHLLGSNQGKTFSQIKPGFCAEDASGSCASAVLFRPTSVEHSAQKIVVRIVAGSFEAVRVQPGALLLCFH